MPIAPPFGLKLTKEQREKLESLGRTFIKSAAPTGNDDETQGYRRFDRWFDDRALPDGMEIYICLDATATTAKWDHKSLDADDLSDLFAAKASLNTDVSFTTVESKGKHIVKDASAGLSVAEVSGTIINNYGQTDDMNLTLPAAQAGLNFVLVCGTTVAKYVRITPNAADAILLHGVAGAAGEYVQLAEAVVGQAITFTAFQTGATAYDWMAVAVTGDWEAE